MHESNKIRVRKLGNAPIREDKQYVLYWMQAYRRLESNHALDYAFHLAKKLGRELVVYEGLRKDYPYNSARLHRFIMEGMAFHCKEAERLGLNYWPYVETKSQPAERLLQKIAENAVAVVSDDFPCFIIPEQNRKLSRWLSCAFFLVDSNSVLPLALYEKEANAARVLRLRMHKLFLSHPPVFAKPKYTKQDFSERNQGSQPPFVPFQPNQLDKVLQELSFSENVHPVPGVQGGRKEGLRILEQFLGEKLGLYGEFRSQPNSPERTPVSGLSPYLHFGMISAEEVFQRALEKGNGAGWDLTYSQNIKPGEKEIFFGKDLSTNQFLDELLVWRDIGFLLFWKSPSFGKGLEVLPDWTKKNLEKHAGDKRSYTYSLEEWEAQHTHDPLWNAAQRELALTGRMHNYLRMLWGKKILEWSPDYETALEVMEYLNHKYAYDGRNPNSYTGILWCFGLFDRPWFPERPVFGNIRFMSSDSTKKKFKIQPYLDYVNHLQAP